MHVAEPSSERLLPRRGTPLNRTTKRPRGVGRGTGGGRRQRAKKSLVSDSLGLLVQFTDALPPRHTPYLTSVGDSATPWAVSQGALQHPAPPKTRGRDAAHRSHVSG